jgi:tryptophan halogenase
MRVEAGEYNRLMGEEADALRDFTLAHYLCATRAEPLWQQVRAAPAPDRLAARMELFKANGRILVFDQETFEETDWASLFLGSGWLPVTLEAQIALRVARVTSAEAGLIADQVRGLAESMPPHPVYLRHASQPRAG